MTRFAAGLLLLFHAVASGQTSPGGSGARSDTGVDSAAACVPSATNYCAHYRFGVSVTFSAPSLGISNASATAVSLTNDTGYFWFFSPNNVELVVKVVDGRAFNDYYWVFYGALTDVAYTITVTDAETGAVKRYTNPAGNQASASDVTAFSGTSNCTYLVGPPIPATFGRNGGFGSVSVTTPPNCAWTAASTSLAIINVVPSSVTGSGSVSFQVVAILGNLSRHGTLTVAGATVTISQNGELLP
jgi:hypothetical protein